MSNETLGLTLLHFGWQGAGLAAFAALSLHLLRQRTPQTRYAVLVCVLVAMAFCPPITYVALGARSAAGESADALAVEGAFAVDDALAVDDAPAVGDAGAAAPHTTDPGVGADLPAGAGADVPAGWGARLRPALPWIVAVWLGGVLVLSLRLLGAWLQLRRLGTRDTAPVPVWLAERSSALLRRLDIGRPVRLVLSVRIAVPSVTGWLKPVVLFPIGALTGLTPVQIEAILAHELAHIRRHDALVNAVQTVVETLLFYHPAVWWLSRQIREERERSCDDVAVALCGDARTYAGALLGLETLRGSRAALALAADGGSLLGRVRRLFHPDQSEVEMFPRWTAGFAALTVALFLVVGSDLAGSVMPGGAPPAAETPTRAAEGTGDGGAPATEATAAATRRDETVGEAKDRGGLDHRRDFDDRRGFETLEARDGEDDRRDKRRGQDAGETRATPPDTVIVHPGGGTLAERIAWAQRTAQANGFGTRWIAWAVRPTPSLEGFIYSDRSRRVTTNNLSFRGTITGSLQGFNPGGLDLASVVGRRAPDDVVVLLRIGRNGDLSAARLSSFGFRVSTGGEPLLWLGGAPASESVPLLVERFEAAQDTWLKEDLATAVGVHDTPDVVVPVLIGWAESDEPEDVREEAVEWLGAQPDPRSLEALVRATTRDPSREVRAEAAETLGELDLPAATDALLEVARTHQERAVRQEAVEALGERGDERALDGLVRIARDDPERSVRAEAVETIGEHDSPRRIEVLETIIREDPDPTVREEAIETLSEVAPPERTLEVLREQLSGMTDRRLAEEAVEQIGELGGPQALRALEEVALTHPDERVREEAVETYVEAGRGPEVAAFLVEIAETDESPRVREEALDALTEMPGDAGIEALIALARSGSTREIRISAIEALADSDDPRAAEALDALLRRDPPR